MARWLVTGASGQLGGHVLRLLERRDDATVLALTRGGPIATAAPVASVALDDAAGLREAVRTFRPAHILHIGAMTAVGDCFAKPDAARQINTDATRALAEAAAECGARFVFTSTDMVFGGDSAPYRETDDPRPLSVYGRTKRDAELAVHDVPRTLTVRIPLMYGEPLTARPSTFVTQLAALRAGQPLKLFTDEFRTPVCLEDAAAALIALARSDRIGVIHIAGPERLSRFEMLKRAAAVLGVTSPNLVAISRLSIESAEPRPADLSLDGSQFGREFPGCALRAMKTATLAGS